MNPRFHERARASGPGTGSSTVISYSHSFVCNNLPHFSFSQSHTNLSVPVAPQGVQDAFVDPAAAQSARPLISFNSNASITAPLHFLASNHPQGMPPLSFLSPIQQAPNPLKGNLTVGGVRWADYAAREDWSEDHLGGERGRWAGEATLHTTQTTHTHTHTKAILFRLHWTMPKHFFLYISLSKLKPL